MPFLGLSKALSPIKVCSPVAYCSLTAQSRTATTNKSPIETPTSHTTTTPAQNIAETLQSTFTKVSDASVVAARTATAGVNAAYGKISGMDAGMNKSSATMPANETRTLPSQELEGQQPMSGPMDGVGALPGGAGEVGVAILPNDKSERHCAKILAVHV